jgi:hypothetical protein
MRRGLRQRHFMGDELAGALHHNASDTTWA